MPDEPQDDVGALQLCLGQHGGHTDQLSDLTLKPWTVPVRNHPDLAILLIQAGQDAPCLNRGEPVQALDPQTGESKDCEYHIGEVTLVSTDSGMRRILGRPDADGALVERVFDFHDLPVPEATRFLAAWAAWLSEHPAISEAGHPDDDAGGGPLHA